MTKRLRIGGWIAFGGLWVAAWSAVPTIQWCRLAWADVPLRCLLADDTRCAASSAKPAPPGCGAEAGCPDDSACPDRAPAPRESRAWCPVPGAPRIAPSRFTVDAPLAGAIVPLPALELPPARRFERPPIAEARPPTPPGRTPPSIRAPPRG